MSNKDFLLSVCYALQGTAQRLALCPFGVLAGGMRQRLRLDFAGARKTLVKRGAYHQYPTSILVKPAFELPPWLHGTVAQDRLSDPPGHDDAKSNKFFSHIYLGS